MVKSLSSQSCSHPSSLLPSLYSESEPKFQTYAVLIGQVRDLPVPRLDPVCFHWYWFLCTGASVSIPCAHFFLRSGASVCPKVHASARYSPQARTISQQTQRPHADVFSWTTEASCRSFVETRQKLPRRSVRLKILVQARTRGVTMLTRSKPSIPTHHEQCLCEECARETFRRVSSRQIRTEICLYASACI